MRIPLRYSVLLAVMTLSACADDPVRNDVREMEVGNSFDGAALRPGEAAGHRHVALLDDCDPRDPAWNATGGCALREGSVNNAEFNAFVVSPFSTATVGHPAWRNDPTYLKTRPRHSFRVTNEGGRAHTFTEVANYGGGRVPPLNVGMTPAPECLLAPGMVDPTLVPPRGRLEVSGLAAGHHRFQCCLHPWMRTLIKVQ